MWSSTLLQITVRYGEIRCVILIHEYKQHVGHVYKTRYHYALFQYLKWKKDQTVLRKRIFEIVNFVNLVSLCFIIPEQSLSFINNTWALSAALWWVHPIRVCFHLLYVQMKHGVFVVSLRYTSPWGPSSLWWGWRSGPMPTWSQWPLLQEQTSMLSWSGGTATWWKGKSTTMHISSG